MQLERPIDAFQAGQPQTETEAGTPSLRMCPYNECPYDTTGYDEPWRQRQRQAEETRRQRARERREARQQGGG